MDAAGKGPSNDDVSAHTQRNEQNEFRETPRNSLEIKQFSVRKPRLPVALVALSRNFPSTVGLCGNLRHGGCTVEGSREKVKEFRENSREGRPFL